MLGFVVRGAKRRATMTPITILLGCLPLTTRGIGTDDAETDKEACKQFTRRARVGASESVDACVRGRASDTPTRTKEVEKQFTDFVWSARRPARRRRLFTVRFFLRNGVRLARECGRNSRFNWERAEFKPKCYSQTFQCFLARCGLSTTLWANDKS